MHARTLSRTHNSRALQWRQNGEIEMVEWTAIDSVYELHTVVIEIVSGSIAVAQFPMLATSIILYKGCVETRFILPRTRWL